MYVSVLPTLFIFLVICCLSWQSLLSSLALVMPVVYVFLLLIFFLSRASLLRVSEASLFAWIPLRSGGSVDFTVLMDVAATEFSMVLLFLSICIQFYAFAYFKKDPDLARFSLLLAFFIFFMLLMINTSSWVFTFVAWEGVGLLSFLLVSFWYSKTNTLKSGFKVLFYNRLGDLFFFVAIALILFLTKSDNFLLSLSLFDLFGGLELAAHHGVILNSLISFAVIVVVLSKSAQFGFHIWLLEAMEAPLPASSLIHSATLVCAGVVLLTKTPAVVYFGGGLSGYLVLWSCATSCALSASALFNYDIKKVLAYSTGSHVSLMLALTVAAGHTCGYTYTLVHASSKVFIFLLFGFIIDANGGVRDIRKMGAFSRSTGLAPFALVGAFFLSSLPFFPLAFMKDGLALNLLTGGFLFDSAASILMFAAVFNYLYMGRLVFKIFFGDALGVRGSYLSLGLPLGRSSGAVYKISGGLLRVGPLIVLSLYIFFIESATLLQLSADYLFTFNKIIDSPRYLFYNATLQYLGYSNSFFFFAFFISKSVRLFR